MSSEDLIGRRDSTFATQTDFLGRTPPGTMKFPARGRLTVAIERTQSPKRTKSAPTVENHIIHLASCISHLIFNASS